MFRLPKTAGKIFLLSALLLSLSNSGCTLFWEGFGGLLLDFSGFWNTTPLIPVSPYYSQLIEDTYHEEERYNRVAILDPVEGEHAPIYCLDPPSEDEIYRALPDKTSGGLSFIAETTHNNVRIAIEPIVDSLGECRFYPLVGPARLHKCHYKCTIYYDRIIRSDWPIPFSHIDETQEVVYIDKDHLIRCAGPQVE